MTHDPTRRKVLAAAAGLAGGAVAMAGGARLKRWLDQPAAHVAIYRATYDSDLVDLFVRGLREFPAALARARGGRVVLKPNLVEAAPGRPINTDPRVVAALVEAFRHHGAAEVLVAEGPGHHRDTELILEMTGLAELLLRLPRTVVDCDLFVSVAKMKTHHWVGATLTMKNLFGTVPGAIYGWPKNPLHHAGLDQSILDLWAATRPGLGVVDGIVGMQGDGPILGASKDAGVVVMGDQLPAVDATAARVMGLRPERLRYLEIAARLGGTVAEGRIRQVGEGVSPDPFDLLPEFDHLRA